MTFFPQTTNPQVSYEHVEPSTINKIKSSNELDDLRSLKDFKKNKILDIYHTAVRDLEKTLKDAFTNDKLPKNCLWRKEAELNRNNLSNHIENTVASYKIRLIDSMRSYADQGIEKVEISIDELGISLEIEMNKQA